MEVSFRYRAKAMLMKLILGDPENFCVFPPNQKAERQQLFGTGLVRRCPQRLFSPFFTFPWAIFFCPFRLSLAPTICLWVSKDEWNCVMPILKYGQCSQPFVPLSPFLERPLYGPYSHRRHVVPRDWTCFVLPPSTLQWKTWEWGEAGKTKISLV